MQPIFFLSRDTYAGHSSRISLKLSWPDANFIGEKRYAETYRQKYNKSHGVRIFKPFALDKLVRFKADNGKTWETATVTQVHDKPTGPTSSPRRMVEVTVATRSISCHHQFRDLERSHPICPMTFQFRIKPAYPLNQNLQLHPENQASKR